jgi:hypothetical protein
MSWDAETTQPDRDEPRRVRTRALVLTIAAHPDPRRIGELARLCRCSSAGESGTGKELVARAIHAASPRAARPYVPINMAALNPHTAVAELFGHARGAFTGASRPATATSARPTAGRSSSTRSARPPLEIQAMLLRVLETGEIQPVGGAPARRVDVRVIAATDADLEEPSIRGEFRLVAPPPPRRLRDLAMPPLAVGATTSPACSSTSSRAELRRAGRPERFDRLAEDAAQHLPAAAMLHLLARPVARQRPPARNVARANGRRAARRARPGQPRGAARRGPRVAPGRGPRAAPAGRGRRRRRRGRVGALG